MTKSTASKAFRESTLILLSLASANIYHNIWLLFQKGIKSFNTFYLVPAPYIYSTYRCYKTLKVTGADNKLIKPKI